MIAIRALKTIVFVSLAPVLVKAQMSATNAGLRSTAATIGTSVSKPVFIENVGQFDPRVKFQARVGGQTAWLTDKGVVFDASREKGAQEALHGGVEDLERGTLLPKPPHHSDQQARMVDRLAFAEDFAGSNGRSSVEGRDPQSGVYNYFQSRDSRQWRTNVRSFSEVVYRDLWPGVDLRIYGNGADLEQEFLVQPGGNLSNVRISYRGIDGLTVAMDGSLEIGTVLGKLRETRPRIYQQIAGKSVVVDGRFKLTGEKSYTFDVGAYATQYALLIDPTLLYSTFIGGSNSEAAVGIAVDNSGSTYITGSTPSLDFPTTPGAFQVNASVATTFISKLNSTGSGLVYSTYLGSLVSATAIAVDASGDAFITGTVVPAGGGFLPVTANAYWPTNSTQHCASFDFFVTELNPTGSQLLYSSCFNAAATPNAIALDTNGKPFIAGSVSSSIPTSSNAFQATYPGAQQSGFVMTIDTTASGSSSLVYGTYLGIPAAGTNLGASVKAIAVDSFGKVYVTGFTFDGFPVTPGAFQTIHGPCIPNGPSCPTLPNAFVAKLDPSVSGSQALIYATYLGGRGNTLGNAIAVDAAGSAYITGTTQQDFPVTLGSFQTNTPVNVGGGTVGFVTKLNAGGSQLTYSTFLESTCTGNCLSGSVAGGGIALDLFGDAYVTGSTNSSLFPVTTDAFQSTYLKPVCQTDCSDAFLIKLNPAGSAPVYSSYLGGIGDDVATAVAIDQTGDAYVAGHTSSANFPTSANAFQPSMHGTGDAFVTKFPLGSTFRALQVAPNTGGNAGVATPTLFGSGLHNGVALTLRGSGPDIIASPVSVGPYGLDLNATFDLHGAVPAPRDVIVRNTDGTTVTLPQAFTVTGGGAPNLTVAITSPLKILSSWTTDFYVTVSNTGNVDAVGVPFWFAGIPNNWSLGLDFEVSSPPQFTNTPNHDVSDTPIVVKTPTILGQVVPLFISSIPAGSHITLHFQATPHSLVGPAVLAAWVNPPYFHSPLDPGVSNCLETIGTEIVTRLIGLVVPVGCGADVYDLTKLLFTAAANGNVNQVFSTTEFYTLIIKSTVNCGLAAIPGGQIINAITSEISDLSTLVAINTACDATFYQISRQHTQLQSVGSFDPNGLVGTAGVGSAQYVSPEQALTYAIYFQNLPTATAPAHNVTVVQPVDPGIDLSTIQLNGIAIGNSELPISPGLNPSGGVTTVQTTLDLRPAESILVNVSVNLNVAGRTITWTFISIDPVTGLPTTNPAAGFLPPGAEGSVSYSVMPSKTATTGELVDAQATIVFDANPAMNTAIWANTIDNTPPVSHVSAMAATSTCPAFRVSWSGSDVGSGLQGFTIYVSDSGAPYTTWLSNTTAASADYQGAAGHSYSFYGIATDLTGNMEGAKTSPEASTSVTASGPCGAPSLSGQLSNVVQSGTTVTATLTLTNTGFTAAQAVNINQMMFRTLSGSGTVTLASPAIPAAEGPLAIGASTTVALTLNVPTTVTRFSLTESGTIKDGASNTYNYSIAQTVIP